MKPFDDFPGHGKQPLGRPRTGAACRTGYGLALQQMTGQTACAYCKVDLTDNYYRWLLMQVDHVIPVSVGRLLGIPDDYIEDAVNKVLACSGCNGFLNRYSPPIEAIESWTLDKFVELRDTVFADRQRKVADRRTTELEIFKSKPWETRPPLPSTLSQPPRTKPKNGPGFKLDEIPGVVEFIDNDAGYLAWVADYPDGFVVNTYVTPSASYLMLHHSRCWTITGKPARGLVWTKDFVKVCSLDLGALERWGRFHSGGNLKPCGHCKPTFSSGPMVRKP